MTLAAERIVLAIVFCCTITVLSSCDNDDEEDIKTQSIGDVVISIDNSAIYKELGITEYMTTKFNNGKVMATDTVLIYDKNGDLVRILGTENNNMEPVSIKTDSLPNGNYTIVLWQTIRGINTEARAWIMSNEEQLNSVLISTTYASMVQEWAVGMASATITVNGNSIKTDLVPKAMGSIINMQVDGFTEDNGYSNLRLYDTYHKYSGFHLSPTYSETDRWTLIADNWGIPGQLKLGNSTKTFFTLSHGDDMTYALCDITNGKETCLCISKNVKLNTGENKIYYLNIDHMKYQPPFFGNAEDFNLWKNDRDAGKLIGNPCINWGCSSDIVKQHVESNQWWLLDNDNLTYWEEFGMWYYKDYRLANEVYERYIYETEDGQNLCMVYAIYPYPEVTLETINNTLVKQGYVYSGKANFPGYDPRDIFFSADGKTEVQTFVNNSSKCINVIYQPTDPNDFQYITKE